MVHQFRSTIEIMSALENVKVILNNQKENLTLSSCEKKQPSYKLYIAIWTNLYGFLFLLSNVIRET